nr:MAG TPA: hypothetical protein [Microviridae sp.]
MKKLSDVEIYFSRSDTDYLYLLRSAVIAYCAREYRNPDNEKVTAFTCSELLSYVDKNFKERKIIK